MLHRTQAFIAVFTIVTKAHSSFDTPYINKQLNHPLPSKQIFNQGMLNHTHTKTLQLLIKIYFHGNCILYKYSHFTGIEYLPVSNICLLYMEYTKKYPVLKELTMHVYCMYECSIHTLRNFV